MPTPTINDDGSVTFTLSDGSKVTATVEEDGLFLHAHQEPDVSVGLTFDPNAGNEGWIETHRKAHRPERTPIDTTAH